MRCADQYKMRHSWQKQNKRYESVKPYAMLLSSSITAIWMWSFVLVGVVWGQQQVFIARPVRSSYGEVLGWNSIGGINPTIGHMSKDELHALLEAWHEVEANKEPMIEPEIMEQPEAPAPDPPAAPAMPPPPPPPLVEDAPLQRPPAGEPLTVRLPAFVPIQLSAFYTPPAGASLIGNTIPALATATNERQAPRVFRFMNLSPPAAVAPPVPNVVRNTLDSVDAGTAPTATRVKPQIKSTTNSNTPKTAAAPPPPSPQSHRPRFELPPPPPFLSHVPGPLQLVPSSQLLSNWH